MIAQATLTAAAAGDYADNDVISDSATVGVPIQFTVAERTGGRGTIKSARITSSVQAFVAALELFLFRENVSASTTDDNVAESLDLDDRLSLAWRILFPASADFGEVSLTEKVLDPPLGFECDDDDTKLYGVLVARDAFTNESAGMTFTIELDIEPRE